MNTYIVFGLDPAGRTSEEARTTSPVYAVGLLDRLRSDSPSWRFAICDSEARDVEAALRESVQQAKAVA